MLALSVYGTVIPSNVRCDLPGSVGCTGGLLGPAVVPAGAGDQWFDVTMYDWGFWILDSTTGLNESGTWTVFEGYTIHINATSLPPDAAIGGTAYHGLGVEVNATGQQLMSLAAPVGRWVSATFVAPSTPYYHQHIWCTIQCGPGHGSQQEYNLNIVPPVQYPKATSSANISLGPAPLSVHFSGNATSGTPPYNLSWSFGDGSSGSFGSSVSHAYALGGIYYATLTVTDSKGAQGRSSVTITVLSGAPLRATLTALSSVGVAPFGAAFSTVGHGGTPPYQYLWSFGDGTPISGPNATTHEYSAPGIYAAEVTVTDSVGAVDRAISLVTVHASNGTFSLVAKATPPNGTVPQQTTLNASASGGTAPYSYSWILGDGTNATGPSVPHLYNQTGSYEATVFAVDSSGRTAAGTVNVVVVATNSSGGGGCGGDVVCNDSAQPLAAASPLVVRLVDSPSSGGAPLSVAASASIQGGNGTNESVTWKFGDGATAAGQVVSHSFSQVGSYNVTVTAVDSGGNSGSASTVVHVGAIAMQIVLNSTGGDAPFSLAAATTITGGSGSYGPVTWSWGDGGSGTGYLVTHAYGPNTSGSIEIQAHATDSSGTAVNASMTLLVQGPPVATLALGRGNSAGLPVAVTFTLTVSGGSGRYATTALWNFGDLTSTRGPVVETHDYNRTGHYRVTVETNDSLGRITIANAWVNISPQFTLPKVSGTVWYFQGVPNPDTAALVLMGFVAVTGLAFLYRKHSRQRARSVPAGSGRSGAPGVKSPIGSGRTK